MISKTNQRSYGDHERRSEFGLSWSQGTVKRSFDFILGLLGLMATGWIIVIAWGLASADTGANGFFTQERIGRHGRRFKIVKIRTMKTIGSVSTTVTTVDDIRITPLGRFWRRTKIDELPQLFNIVLGHMSFVGPRPDVPGFADTLKGEDRIVLSVRPGITGPATLKYRNEEQLLAMVDDSETYNREVIFPDKVAINREYVTNWSFKRDLVYIFRTMMNETL